MNHIMGGHVTRLSPQKEALFSYVNRRGETDSAVPIAKAILIAVSIARARLIPGTLRLLNCESPPSTGEALLAVYCMSCADRGCICESPPSTGGL